MLSDSVILRRTLGLVWLCVLMSCGSSEGVGDDGQVSLEGLPSTWVCRQLDKGKNVGRRIYGHTIEKVWVAHSREPVPVPASLTRNTEATSYTPTINLYFVKALNADQLATYIEDLKALELNREQAEIPRILCQNSKHTVFCLTNDDRAELILPYFEMVLSRD